MIVLVRGDNRTIEKYSKQINYGDTFNLNYFQKRNKSCVLLRTLLAEEESEAVSSVPRDGRTRQQSVGLGHKCRG